MNWAERPLPNSYWVLPGQLLAGEHPLGRSGTGAPRLRALLEAGVGGFIDLTEPGECRAYEALLPPGVLYLRQPIPDQQVPHAPEQMHAIQRALAEALTRASPVYVHCRAGIGRTGTVIGCFLIERGTEPALALPELNRLWRQSARSASWPEVPQTTEQAEFIRGWRPRPPSEPASEAVPLRVVGTVRERFLGALLGLACGDALAAATQYRRPGSFGAVGDLLGGGPFELPRGAWSDDTAMALCLAESLVARDAFDAADQLRRYQRWQLQGHLSATGQCLGITAATARALAGMAPEAVPAAATAEPEALSRVAPAVLHGFADAAQAIEQAGQAAGLTGAARPVIDACRLLAAQLHAALRGEPRSQVLHPAAAQFHPRPLQREVAALPGTLEAAARADGDALDVLRLALRAFSTTGNFRDGALQAVNHGGHSDVIGAVYGQLAGAFYGVRAIPPAWLAALAGRGRIESLADELLTAALVRVAANMQAS